MNENKLKFINKDEEKNHAPPDENLLTHLVFLNVLDWGQTFNNKMQVLL